MEIWLVNSNNNEDNGNPNGFRYMLHQNRVIAYYDRRTEIDKIQENDLVLLYHNQTGIIAVGFALKIETHDFSVIQEVEHWANVNWIWKATFDEKINQFKNPIDRRIIGIDNVFGTVLKIDSLNTNILLTEIGRRQNNNPI